jgi:iron complex outermembrane recepter protein
MTSKFIRVAGVGGACLMLVAPQLVLAQTAGTIAAEDKAGEDIIVSGKKLPTTGIEIVDAPKARAIVTRDYIEHTVPGQSIFNAINMVPGVNYVAGDPYGGNGGSIRIRGFDASRIAFSFDGLPLNDAGNYAIYSSSRSIPNWCRRSTSASGRPTSIRPPPAPPAVRSTIARSCRPNR